jgi:hypothetical protein
VSERGRKRGRRLGLSLAKQKRGKRKKSVPTIDDEYNHHGLDSIGVAVYRLLRKPFFFVFSGVKGLPLSRRRFLSSKSALNP